MERIAVIADIHGNIWALDAVLENIRRRDIVHTINLGDSLAGPLAPAETADRLMMQTMTTLSGNWDRMLHSPSASDLAFHSYRYAYEQLSQRHIEWLRQLPKSYKTDALYCCHGTPHADDQPLVENITEHGVFVAPDEMIMGRLGGIQAEVVLCGHTHVPRCVALANGQLIVNPGSVGLPAYEDDTPYSHRMEAGSPHARYAIIERQSHGWQVDFILVAYDWNAAVRVAQQNGREDYVRALTSGRV